MPIADYVTLNLCPRTIGRAAQEYLDTVGGPQFSSELFGPAVVKDVDGGPLPSVNVAGAIWFTAGATTINGRGKATVDPSRSLQTSAARQTFVALAERLNIPEGLQIEVRKSIDSTPGTDPLWMHRWMESQPSDGLVERVYRALRSL